MNLLKALQEDLLQVKRAYPSSTLAKGNTPAPYPIRLTVDLPAPPDAAVYDIQSLRQAIASELRTLWLDALPQAGHVMHVLTTAQKQFAHLLSLVPECKEAYTSVDQHGATTRRYATVSPDATLIVDTTAVPTGQTTTKTTTKTKATAKDNASPQDHPIRASKAATNEGSTPLESELRWYRRRCGAGLSVEYSADHSSVLLDCLVQPTDPEWQGGAVRLRLQVDVAAYHARSKGSVVVQLILHEEDEMVLREDVQEVMGLMIAQDDGRGRVASLGPLVLIYKHVEGYITNLVSQAPETHEDHNISSTYEDATTTLGALSLGAAAPQHPVQIQLNNLRLDNVAAVEPLSVRLQVMCNRCKTRCDVDLGDASSDAQCMTCGETIVVMYTPQLLHANNNVLGTLRCQQCVPVDVLPSVFGVQCDHCSAGGSLRNVQVGALASRECRRCHTSMSVWIAGVEFVVKQVSHQHVQHHRAPTGSAQPKHSRPAMTPGVPLPDTGTCRHYRHSHRWLRFPCCGRLYACDLCHEEGSEDGHDAKWATRMVCGFCSREQALASQCAHCGKRLATSAGMHWGGCTGGDALGGKEVVAVALLGGVYPHKRHLHQRHQVGETRGFGRAGKGAATVHCWIVAIVTSIATAGARQ